MSTPKALIISAPGTNRDHDLAYAFELAGANPQIVHIAELSTNPALLADAQLIGVAGGFSFGDALGAGRMMALDLMTNAGDSMREFVESGRPVIGICNGFQVLAHANLVPGSLGHNAQGRFECRWVVLEVDSDSRSLWTKGITDPIHCPIAHGEGRYVHPDPANLDAAGQVALRYRSTNPNGSVDDIAGVTNTAGNVLGLMPHPENNVIPRQHPHGRRGIHAEHLALKLFQNGVRAAAQM